MYMSVFVFVTPVCVFMCVFVTLEHDKGSLYFCKCLTHILKGLQWMLTDEKSRAEFTKFGFGNPDEIISQR